MIDKELKNLIDTYCNGKEPSDEEMNEIMDKVIELNADPEEVNDYMMEREAHPIVAQETPMSTKYNVVLEDAHKGLLMIMKVLKQTLDIDLQDAKGLVQDLPKVIFTTEDKSKADELVNKIQANKGVAHVEEQKVEKTDYEALKNADFDLSEYEGLDIDQLCEKGDLLCQTGKPENIYKGIAILDKAANDAVMNINDPSRLEKLINLVTFSKYTVLVFYLPDQAEKGFKGLLSMESKLPNQVNIPLFYAYGWGVGTKKDKEKAFEYASKAFKYIEHTNNDDITDYEVIGANLAMAKCYDEGWGQDMPSFLEGMKYYQTADKLIKSTSYNLDQWEKEVVSDYANGLANLKAATQTLIKNEDGTYKDLKGVIYSSDKSTLLKFPKDFSGSYTVVDGTRKIGKKAAFFCKELEEITFPESLEIIETEAFYGCKNLTTINFNEGLNSIMDGAFQSCDVLTNFELPQTLRTIGKNAFEYCKALRDETVVVPDSVISWGKDAISAGTLLVPANMYDTIKKSKGMLSTTKVEVKS